MNNVIEAILNRRSIRKYEFKQIKDEELDAILQAGLYAPSGLNQQGSKFVVIQNEKAMNRLIEYGKKVRNSNESPFYGAPTVVVIFGNKKDIAPVENSALCAGNMMNAAYSLGLGSCWIHCVKDIFEKLPEGIDFKYELGITDEYEAIGSVILGYGAGDEPEAKERKQDRIIRV